MVINKFSFLSFSDQKYLHLLLEQWKALLHHSSSSSLALMVIPNPMSQSKAWYRRDVFPHDSGAFSRLGCDNSAVAPSHLVDLARHTATPSTFSAPSLAASSPSSSCELAFHLTHSSFNISPFSSSSEVEEVAGGKNLSTSPNLSPELGLPSLPSSCLEATLASLQLSRSCSRIT